MKTCVSSSLTLPNGEVLNNRIVKASMSEYMADASTNKVNEKIIRSYLYWAQSTAAMLLTGNICVSKTYLEAPNNIAVTIEDLNDKIHFSLLKKWAATVHSSGSNLIAQISHPGRQCPMSVSWSPIAPSAVPLKLDPFFKPRAMTVGEIEQVEKEFVDTAFVLYKAGFKGIELHAAHGYLLSIFLSPITNLRDDEYGGSLENRSRIIFNIIEKIRNKVDDPQFIIGIKLNSSDFQKGGFEADEAIKVCQDLEKVKIDFIELSGGNYETGF